MDYVNVFRKFSRNFLLTIDTSYIFLFICDYKSIKKEEISKSLLLCYLEIYLKKSCN